MHLGGNVDTDYRSLKMCEIRITYVGNRKVVNYNTEINADNSFLTENALTIMVA